MEAKAAVAACSEAVVDAWGGPLEPLAGAGEAAAKVVAKVVPAASTAALPVMARRGWAHSAAQVAEGRAAATLVAVVDAWDGPQAPPAGAAVREGTLD